MAQRIYIFLGQDDKEISPVMQIVLDNLSKHYDIEVYPNTALEGVIDYPIVIIKKIEDETNEVITLGEMDDMMYAEHDKNLQAKIDAGTNELLSKHADAEQQAEISEEEYNDLFQQDRTDQFNDVEKDIRDRSEEYKAGRPLDP